MTSDWRWQTSREAHDGGACDAAHGERPASFLSSPSSAAAAAGGVSARAKARARVRVEPVLGSPAAAARQSRARPVCLSSASSPRAILPSRRAHAVATAAAAAAAHRYGRHSPWINGRPICRPADWPAGAAAAGLAAEPRTETKPRTKKRKEKKKSGESRGRRARLDGRPAGKPAARRAEPSQARPGLNQTRHQQV